jgi:hypothetical protein
MKNLLHGSFKTARENHGFQAPPFSSACTHENGGTSLLPHGHLECFNLLETAVGRVEECVHGRAGQGATTRNSGAVPRSCNAAMCRLGACDSARSVSHPGGEQANRDKVSSHRLLALRMERSTAVSRFKVPQRRAASRHSVPRAYGGIPGRRSAAGQSGGTGPDVGNACR